MNTQLDWPINTVRWTIAVTSQNRHHWVAAGTREGSTDLAVEQIPIEWIPEPPAPGPGYDFEYTRLSGRTGVVLVGVRTPSGTRYGLDEAAIIDRQRTGRIEDALSEVSTLGWAAGYLLGAAQDAWRLVVAGPRKAAAAALDDGTGADMQNALRTVLTSAARHGWWPQDPDDIRLTNDDTYVGYLKIPLAQRHARAPIPGLTAGATSAEVYQHLASLWEH